MVSIFTALPIQYNHGSPDSFSGLFMNNDFLEKTLVWFLMIFSIVSEFRVSLAENVDIINCDQNFLCSNQVALDPESFQLLYLFTLFFSHYFWTVGSCFENPTFQLYWLS